MRTKAVLSFLVLSAVALSGCAGDEPALREWRTEPETTKPLHSAPVPTDDEPSDAETDAAPANAAPVANLTMVVPNGTQPGNVTFTLDGGDADGDALDWTFTVGNLTENGTALPATVNATLEPGNWTATLTVSDGRNETVASMTVVVGGAVEDAEQAFSGSWLTGNVGEVLGANSGLPSAVAFPEAADGVTHTRMDIAAATWGLPFHATFDCEALVLDSMYFYDASGALLARLLDLDEGDICDIRGTVPEGTTLLVFSSMGGGDGVSYLASSRSV